MWGGEGGVKEEGCGRRGRSEWGGVCGLNLRVLEIYLFSFTRLKIPLQYQMVITMKKINNYYEVLIAKQAKSLFKTSSLQTNKISPASPTQQSRVRWHWPILDN